MQALRSMCHQMLQWVCDCLWRIVDSQDQYLGIQLDITNACNLSCAHCYHAHHKNSGALTYEQWISVIDQYQCLLKKLHMEPRITLCGGEPLLCPFLLPLLDEVRSRFPDCQLLLLSNGTLVSEKIANALRKANVHVQVSMDGPDATRHDAIRGNGSFEKAVSGCRVLKDVGVTFHHLAVLSKRTSGWIEDFFKLPKKTGAMEMHFVRLVPEGLALKMLTSGDDAPLNPSELKHVYETILRQSRLSGVNTSTRGPLWHLIDERLGSSNNIGMSAFVVGYRGEFKVSSRVSAVLGNVMQDSMEKLFLDHPVMRKLRRGEIDVCGQCQHYNKCRGDRNVSYATYGHFFGPDPGCWLYPSKLASDL